MSLLKGSINALNAIGARRLEFIPEHFASMYVQPTDTRVTELDEWMYKNLDSRYAIVSSLILDTNTNRITEVYQIGVEDAKELTMLSLSCPHLDKK